MMKSVATRQPVPQGPPREGEIRSNTIPSLIHDLSEAGLSGVLTVTDRELRKTVQFGRGTILFATSNDRDDRLNQLLLRNKVLPLAKLLRALELALSTRDRVGEVMIKLKMMTAAEVEKWVKVQVSEIVYSIFNWSRGQYAFEDKPAPAESITLGTPGKEVVILGVRRVVSWARVYEEVGGLNTEYRATKDMTAITAGLPLVPAERDLLKQCDAAPMTLAELCESSPVGDYEVCKSVWALLVVGALMKS